MERKIRELIEKRKSGINREHEKEIERYELVRAILDNPKAGPRELVQRIEKELGYHPQIFVKAELSVNRLGARERVEWVETIRQLGANLGQFAQEGADDYKALHDDIKQTLDTLQYPARRMNPKAILLIFCSTLLNDVRYKESLKALIRIATFKPANDLLYDLIDLITTERGLVGEERVDSPIVRNDTSEAENNQSLEPVGEMPPVAKTQIPRSPQARGGDRRRRPTVTKTEEQIGDEPSRIEEAGLFDEMTENMERLDRENMELRTITQIAEHQVQVLQDQLEQTRNEADKNAITSFFQEMNSVKHSSLLDQFLKVEKLLERLHQQETEIPEELELLPALVEMFSQFLEMQRIEPKYDVGSQKEITLGESDQYEYFGSQFESAEERKTVEVLSSGWTYEDDLIIKPRVREVG